MEVKRYYIVSYIFYIINPTAQKLIRVAQWVRSLDLTTRTSLSPIRSGFAPGFVNYKKGALDSQPILLKVALTHQKIKSKADYINNHILNVFKCIFNIQLIIKLQSDFFIWINQSYQEKHVKCKNLLKFEKRFLLWNIF